MKYLALLVTMLAMQSSADELRRCPGGCGADPTAGGFSHSISSGVNGLNSGAEARCLVPSGGAAAQTCGSPTTNMAFRWGYETTVTLRAFDCIIELITAGAAGETITFTPIFSNAIADVTGTPLVFNANNTSPVSGDHWTGNFASESPYTSGTYTIGINWSNPSTLAKYNVVCSTETTQ